MEKRFLSLTNHSRTWFSTLKPTHARNVVTASKWWVRVILPVPDWWFNTVYTGGGVLVDLGSHIINLLRWFFGEIVEIKGQFGHRFSMDF